jgi:hypothetical protein
VRGEKSARGREESEIGTEIFILVRPEPKLWVSTLKITGLLRSGKRVKKNRGCPL